MLIQTPYTPAHPNAGLRSPPSQRDTHVVLLHLHVQICHANESGGQPEVSGKLLSRIYEQTSTLQHAQPGRTHLQRLYRVYLQIVPFHRSRSPFPIPFQTGKQISFAATQKYSFFFFFVCSGQKVSNCQCGFCVECVTVIYSRSIKFLQKRFTTWPSQHTYAHTSCLPCGRSLLHQHAVEAHSTFT